MIGAIRRWRDARGVAPRKRAWNKPTFDSSGAPLTPAADVVLEPFGKWSEAVKAAGLEPEKHQLTWRAAQVRPPPPRAVPGSRPGAPRRR